MVTLSMRKGPPPERGSKLGEGTRLGGPPAPKTRDTRLADPDGTVACFKPPRNAVSALVIPNPSARAPSASAPSSRAPSSAPSRPPSSAPSRAPSSAPSSRGGVPTDTGGLCGPPFGGWKGVRVGSGPVLRARRVLANRSCLLSLSTLARASMERRPGGGEASPGGLGAVSRCRVGVSGGGNGTVLRCSSLASVWRTPSREPPDPAWMQALQTRTLRSNGPAAIPVREHALRERERE